MLSYVYNISIGATYLRKKHLKLNSIIWQLQLIFKSIWLDGGRWVISSFQPFSDVTWRLPFKTGLKGWNKYCRGSHFCLILSLKQTIIPALFWCHLVTTLFTQSICLEPFCRGSPIEHLGIRRSGFTGEQFLKFCNFHPILKPQQTNL